MGLLDRRCDAAKLTLLTTLPDLLITVMVSPTPMVSEVQRQVRGESGSDARDLHAAIVLLGREWKGTVEEVVTVV